MAKLNPYYVVGFIDGEGSFSVSIGRHKTLKRKLEVRIEFAIELRADDRKILQRIQETIGVGRIYDLNYDRYGWYPHVKYKIGNIQEIKNYLLPFLDKYPLQAKKRRVYALFKQVVLLAVAKKHLSDQGYNKILNFREQMRKFGKKHKLETARIRENRLSSGVRQKNIDLDTARHVSEAGGARNPSLWGPKANSVTRTKS